MHTQTHTHVRKKKHNANGQFEQLSAPTTKFNYKLIYCSAKVFFACYLSFRPQSLPHHTSTATHKLIQIETENARETEAKQKI